MAKKKLEKEMVNFSKEQLLLSKKYREYRDILLAVLENGDKYSFDEVDEKIDNFMKGEVK